MNERGSAVGGGRTAPGNENAPNVNRLAATPTAFTGVSSGRLLSLDVYRGFIMLLLVSGGFGLSSFKAVPGWEWLVAQVDHAAWEGCTFWDLIQPAFTFMVGVAMPFALARRTAQGATQMQLLRHVVWRAFVLVVLSNICSNWEARPGELRLQLINVLSQIAFGYLICFFVLRLRLVLQVGAAAAILVGHWALFAALPGPTGVASRQKT